MPKLLQNEIFVKIHSSGSGDLYAFADGELIGQTFIQGRIKLAVSENFYKGKIISVEEALKIIAKHYNANIVGSLVIAAIQQKIIHPAAVLWITDEKTGKKVPHVLLMRV